MTYVITGGWQCYGPPIDPDSGLPPGTMTASWIRDASVQINAYLSILQDSSINSDNRDALKQLISGFIEIAAISLKSFPQFHAFENFTCPAQVGEDYEGDTAAFFLWII